MITYYPKVLYPWPLPHQGLNISILQMKNQNSETVKDTEVSKWFQVSPIMKTGSYPIQLGYDKGGFIKQI